MNPANTVVLVVDDETMLRFYAVDIFEDRGFTTFEATNSVEALAALDEHPEINVLLTDINMPGTMNGLELAREVRQRWPAVRLIVASGQVRPSADEMPAGGAFVAKPFSPETILRLIDA